MTTEKKEYFGVVFNTKEERRFMANLVFEAYATGWNSLSSDCLAHGLTDTTLYTWMEEDRPLGKMYKMYKRIRSRVTKTHLTDVALRKALEMIDPQPQTKIIHIQRLNNKGEVENTIEKTIKYTPQPSQSLVKLLITKANFENFGADEDDYYGPEDELDKEFPDTIPLKKSHNSDTDPVHWKDEILVSHPHHYELDEDPEAIEIGEFTSAAPYPPETPPTKGKVSTLREWQEQKDKQAFRQFYQEHPNHIPLSVVQQKTKEQQQDQKKQSASKAPLKFRRNAERTARKSKSQTSVYPHNTNQ